MMEASSPLAAMRQPSFGLPSWGARNDFFSFAPAQPAPKPLGSASFNFRDMSRKPNHNNTSDYFSLEPIRGSSPTTTLAADLSQNFHIDQSPQLPTPRRSLFTSNLFGGLDRRDYVTTPPLPPSSPGLHEMMDISPLPHKQPFFAQVEMQSPTPQHTPVDDIAIPSSPPRQNVEAPRPTHATERRKSILLRPNLSRHKGYSTSSMPLTTAEERLPLFRLGVGSSKLSTATSMSMGECFMDSPPKETRPQSANSPSPCLLGARLGKPLAPAAGNAYRNGSPTASHARRTSNPLMRPRKQFRRSLSMFENPAEMVRGKPGQTSSNLHTVMDIDELHQPVLPHFFLEGQPDSIPRITKDTLLEVLDGIFDDEFDQRLVIDCRFEYEFEGGHINGAVNYNDKEAMSSQLFAQALPGKTLLVFHCEYSAHRAPMMARHVRQADRAANAECYPKLTYPEVYILDGGYSSFFSLHRERCFPQNYVEMAAKEHANTCEREMGKLKQNRSKLGRSQTFAFGQLGQNIDDSPTAPPRGRSAGNELMMMDTLFTSPSISANDRGHTRRLVSY